MSLNSTNAQVEFKSNAILGEGPVWDDITEKLYWVDILSGKLFVYDPVKKINAEHVIEGHVGAVALREKGGLVIATEKGFAFYNPDICQLTYIANPETHIPNNRFNDGKCDTRGRFWAGTMAYDIEEGKGSLYCLNPDRSVDLKLSEVTISNGLAWNKQQDKFFYIDTVTRQVCSFYYEDHSGAISNREVVKVLSESEGYPDGMTIDTDDYIWVALYGGSKVIRIDPINGKTVFEVHLPVPLVTSCTFGGSQFNELYITTCRENMTERDKREAPLSGSLFKAQVPFKGLPASRFKG